MAISVFPPQAVAPAAPAAQPVTANPAPVRSRVARVWPWALASLVILSFAGLVAWRIFAPHPDVWTDNAYVRVHYAVIAPRVSGQVVAVRVQNDDVVRAGQVLVELDDRDFRAAVAAAEATLARDRAIVENAAAAVARQGPVIEQANA